LGKVGKKRRDILERFLYIRTIGIVEGWRQGGFGVGLFKPRII